METIRIATTDDLKPGMMKKVMVKETPVLLANLDGTYYAMDDTCPHMKGSLSAGKLEGNHVICPRHGSIFDVTTGKAVQNGKIMFLPAKVHHLMHYEVKVTGRDVLVVIA